MSTAALNPVALNTAVTGGRSASKVALPALGPAWFGGVMGTGILAALSQTVAPAAIAGAGHVVARVVLVVGWLLLVGLTAAFVTRVRRHPGTLAASWRGVGQIPSWGMVSMGLLSIGSATAAVLPEWLPRLTAAAWVLDATFWVVGTLLGLATAFGFTALLVRTDAGRPTTVWGLALVPPMVSATVGGGLVGRVGSPTGQLLLVLASGACFFLGLFLAGTVFAVCYHHYWRVERLAVGAGFVTWIPLGVVGQSTAAAQVLAGRTRPLLLSQLAGPVQAVADVYGIVMLLVGLPLAVWAVGRTLREFAHRTPFTPGWFAMTFPIGTLSLGAHLLGTDSGERVFTVAGVVCWLALCGTWTACAAGAWSAARTGLSARRADHAR